MYLRACPIVRHCIVLVHSRTDVVSGQGREEHTMQVRTCDGYCTYVSLYIKFLSLSSVVLDNPLPSYRYVVRCTMSDHRTATLSNLGSCTGFQWRYFFFQNNEDYKGTVVVVTLFLPAAYLLCYGPLSYKQLYVRPSCSGIVFMYASA